MRARGHFGISARYLHSRGRHFQRVAKGRPRNNLWWYPNVTGLRKKPVIFLAAVALGSGVLVVGAVQSAATRTESQKAELDRRPAQSPEPGAETGPLFASDPNFSTESSFSLGRQEFFFRTMIAVAFVIVLGVAAIYVSKKLLPRIAKLPGKEIRVVETVHLGPRKAVHVLEIGSRRLLIGSTNENITKLADLSGGFADFCPQDSRFEREHV